MTTIAIYIALFVLNFGIAACVPSGVNSKGSSLVSKNKVIYVNESNARELTIKGRLNLNYFYGPPNYGEDPQNDRIESAYILTSHKPIELKSTSMDDDQIIHTKSSLLHIYMDSKEDLIRNFVGKNVEIKADDFSVSINGHHRAPIVAKISSIKLQNL